MFKSQVPTSDPNWSDEDSARVQVAINEFDGAEFWRNDSYLSVWVADVRVLAIYPGYILWPRGRQKETPLPQDLFPRMMRDQDGDFYVLSTFAGR